MVLSAWRLFAAVVTVCSLVISNGARCPENGIISDFSILEPIYLSVLVADIEVRCTLLDSFLPFELNFVVEYRNVTAIAPHDLCKGSKISINITGAGVVSIGAYDSSWTRLCLTTLVLNVNDQSSASSFRATRLGWFPRFSHKNSEDE